MSGSVAPPLSPLEISTPRSDGPSHRQTKWFKLFVRRECWRLSWRGWLALALVFVSIAVGSVLLSYPFLAVNQPVSSSVLVVEGWVHDYAIRRAVEEFNTGRYQQVLVTGGPVTGSGGYSSDYNTAANVGANRLRKAGLPDSALHAVPCRISGRDRTYSSAIALRDWFNDNRQHVDSINILTEGPHARRSRLLFQKAFGSSMRIGTIAIDSPDYDVTQWWKYSEGVREMIGETIAYLYARIFFYAPRNSAGLAVAGSVP
jgi:uncharacterized SAM-binding protein YcdF (DUF218 family)